MRKLLLAAAIASLVSLPLFFSSKRPKFRRTKVIIGKEGDFKTFEAFKVWFVAEDRSPTDKLLTVKLDAKSVPDMKECWEWMKSVDLKGTNIRVHLFAVPPSNAYTIVEEIAST